MNKIRLASATVNQIPLAWEHNRNNLLSVLQEAKKQKIQVLCLPELTITGYGCEDAFLSANTCQLALQILEELIPHTQGLFTVFGLPLYYNNALYNTVAVVADGKLLGFVAKQHLAGYGVHYEPRWFHPWPQGKVVTLTADDHQYSLGDLIFNLDNIKIGFEICEDAWVSARTGLELAARGVDIILNPSASHFAFYKHPIRKQFVLEGAKQFRVAYLYSNLLGNEAGRIIYDGDTLIATPEGFVAMGHRFSFCDNFLVSAEVDIKNIGQENDNKHLSSTPLTEMTEKVQGVLPEWEKGSHIKFEEFSRASALGLFDYLRKSKSQGFVLNLSGGVDSSSCACLVYLMVKFGLEELGEAEFRRRLEHIELPPNPSEFMKKLLFCLYQKTDNNSEITESATQHITKALGMSYASFSIDDLIENYCQKISTVIERPLSWESDDVALQNIQARVRAPGAWLLANIKGALLLTACNRSEAAVGYTTMDGDTSGSLSPIAGVSKTFIQSWLKWLELRGPENLGPIPALKYVTEQVPSAELRPRKKAQTDEQDLMPYVWLDEIERIFVYEKLSPLEILQVMCLQYPKEKPEDLADAIERFFMLWTRNQWKRERLAPTFHLDIESVDPKTWCRYPILGGDYRLEIEKMRRALRA